MKCPCGNEAFSSWRGGAACRECYANPTRYRLALAADNPLIRKLRNTTTTARSDEMSVTLHVEYTAPDGATFVATNCAGNTVEGEITDDQGTRRHVAPIEEFDCGFWKLDVPKPPPPAPVIPIKPQHPHPRRK